MKDVLLQKAMKLNKLYKRRRCWQYFVRITAALVVFCTTYVLILPAITMEQEAFCGQEEHTHTEECFTQKPVLQMHCTLSVQPEDVVLHTHQECCIDAAGKVICTIPENPGHIHEEACYEAPECICRIPEGTGHTHSEECTTATVLTCTLEESQGHTHSAVCTTGRVLTCTVPISEGHVHNESCTGTERVLVCTLEEIPAHLHSDSCSQIKTELSCTQDTADGHVHTEECYVASVVPCSLPETEGHTHGDGCYEVRTIPCPLEETEGHVHGEACYGTGMVSCEIPETPAHVHEEYCYGKETVSCPIPEAPAHAHDALCYEQRGALICLQEECKPHNHDEHCYDSKGNKTCTLSRIITHVHDETCVTDTGGFVSVLDCTKPAHVHEDSCFQSEETTGLEFLCNIGEHRHMEVCFNEESVLTCTIPEHNHDAACVVADLDLTADVETPDQWESAFKAVELTGHWPQDLLAVAQTQLGYQESGRNCVLSGTAIRGYTRYGAKYGTPYDDWDTLFVSFCLDYAAVKDFPTHADRSQWIQLLTEEELYRAPNAYTPKQGDLVFLDMDQQADAPVEIPVEADLVGIVAEQLRETPEEPAGLKIIAGNVNNKVDYVICELSDPIIIGYAELPQSAPDEQDHAEESAVTRKLVHTGPDYTVTVTFGPEAMLPENTVLDVREILPDTDEYVRYYQQSVATIRGDSVQTADEENIGDDSQPTEEIVLETEDELEVSFARFFDIHFVSDGTILEPAAPVDIRIQYAQGIALPDARESVAVHFADTGIELLDAHTSWNLDAMVDAFTFTQNSFSVSGTVLYATTRAIDGYIVWLDGTCGGHVAYTGAGNSAVTVSNSYTLPTEFTSPTTYDYTLKGWYDVTHGQYYLPGDVVTITKDTVFYADWVAADYNFGQYGEDIVSTKDTSEFVTIDVFDFNHLFNVNSSSVNATIDTVNNRHSESWSHVTEGENALGEDSLNFSFVDSNGETASGRLANTSGRANGSLNVYTGGSAVFPGIMPEDLGKEGADLTLLNALFNKDQQVLGKTYVGTGNFLFRYDDNPASEHYGYYYYDSELNAASYHQADKRFYVYNYIEHASSSSSKDFLPLNAPYAKDNPEDKVPSGDLQSGYTYHTTNHNSRTTVNFFFGMRSNIHFYLPNDVGVPVDDYNNPGNLDTNGNPMVFSFSGDDDVWIYVDNKLVLDIGGIHQANSGSINFSTGEVIQGNKVTNLNSLYTDGMKEGGHDLTIYYLERGAGESNCSIYFNLAPRYGLVLYKQDYHTRENLDNVTFGVYLDEACTKKANLWPTHQAAKEDPYHLNTKNIYTTQNGYLSFFGLVAGKTYYIREESPPAGYQGTDDLIRVTLNNHGVDISEVTILGGTNGRTQGYELVSHHMDETNQIVELTLTNQRDLSSEDTTNVRVTKDWIASDTSVIPNTITVHLTKDGQRYGHSMTLGPHNGWVYTWTGLPEDGSTYDVLEDQVPGFELLPPASTFDLRNGDTDYDINWLEVGALEDVISYLLKIDNGYLTLNDGALQITSLQTDEEIPETAVWTSRAAAEGFRLINGDYALTLADGKFQAELIGNGNQTLYYDGEGIFAMQGGNLYYLAVSGSSVTTSSEAYPVQLYKQEKIPVKVIHISLVNSELEEENTTYLKVNKVWNSQSATWDREVTIHLLRDGKDSGIATVLNRNNNWEHVFEGLPIGPVYTVKEAPVAGYEATYSEPLLIKGSKETNWIPSSELTEREDPYLISNSSGWLLTVNNGSLTASKPDTQDEASDNQKWIRTGNKLLNVGTGQYLRYSNSRLLLTDNDSYASDVTLNSNKLVIGNRYLVLNNGSVSTTSRRNSGTDVTLYYPEHSNTTDGYQITVTNTQVIEYLLPHTGGSGVMIPGGLGLLLSAIALGFLFYRKRKGACGVS